MSSKESYFLAWKEQQRADLTKMLDHLRGLAKPTAEQRKVLALLEKLNSQYPRIKTPAWHAAVRRYQDATDYQPPKAVCTAVCPDRAEGRCDPLHFCSLSPGHEGQHQWECGVKS